MEKESKVQAGCKIIEYDLMGDVRVGERRRMGGIREGGNWDADGLRMCEYCTENSAARDG